MLNKPKYSLFKNSSYALAGIVHAIKTETSFKLELIFGALSALAILLLPLEITHQLLLFITLFLVLIVELLNSAVENVVDLVTQKKHPLAKSAKDMGAAAVFFSISLHVLCWIIILINIL